MSRFSPFRPGAQPLVSSRVGLLASLFVGHMLFSVVSNAAFKLSADSRGWRGLLLWQVVGNLSGFVTVLILTALLRHVPLQVAYPLTQGLAAVGVQVFAAWLFFRQDITPMQWLGTLLIVAGILCIGTR